MVVMVSILMVVMVSILMVVMVSILMVLVGDSDLVIQPFMVGWVTLSEWLVCMVDFLVGKDMARAAKTTATRDMATVGTDVPLEVLRPTTHPLLLLITLLTPI